MIPGQRMVAFIAESMVAVRREYMKLTAFADGLVFEPPPGRVGEVVPEVIVLKGTECMRTDAYHRWGQCYTADGLGHWLPKNHPTIIVIYERER